LPEKRPDNTQTDDAGDGRRPGGRSGSLFRRLWPGVILGLLILLILVYPVYRGGSFLLAVWRGELVPPGVHLPGGLALGGLSREEAAAAVEAWIEQRAGHVLEIHAGDLIYRLSGSELGIGGDGAAGSREMVAFGSREIVAAAMQVGRRGPPIRRIRELWRLFRDGGEITSFRESLAAAVRDRVLKLEEETYTPPRHAYRDLESGTVVAEVPGRRLAVEESVAKITEALVYLQPEVHLPMQLLPPAVTAREAAAVEAPYRISRYATRFDPDEVNRSKNIELAALLLNGIIVEPGAVFSYNDTLGPREKVFGFKEAPELLDGNLVTGVGGGICQVSSTLYNALLLADVEVIERYKHSAVTGYVPPGRDATVTYGQMDLRFRNNLPFTIVIRTFLRGGQVAVSLYGQKPLDYQVELHSEVKELPIPVKRHTDLTLPPGTEVVTAEGAKGMLVVVSKTVTYLDTGEKRQEIVSRNLYPAKAKEVRINPLPDIRPNLPFQNMNLTLPGH